MSLKLSESTALRKANKPLMEKRRRARINRCLNELKQIIMDNSREQTTTNHTKWEKADILEMTLAYLKSLQEIAISGVQQHVNGFRECAETVEKFAESGMTAKTIVVRLRDEVQNVEENAECSQAMHKLSGSPQMSPANTSNSGTPQPSDSSSSPDVASTEKATVPQQEESPPNQPPQLHHTIVSPQYFPFLSPTQATAHLTQPNPILFMPNFLCNPTPTFHNATNVFWRPF